jgi:formamidopyrimidine-DNA glycosylase
MPEGPELKHSRDVLRKLILGKFVTRLITAADGRYKNKKPIGMELVMSNLPLKITSVDVKGKFMWWTFEGHDKTWYMFSTYGMSGQWSSYSGRHVGFIIEFNDSGQLRAADQQKLFFNDQRRFGTIKFISNQQDLTSKLKSLGPDILDDSPMTSEIFAERILKKPNRTISEALMDQSCVSGVGNYLKAEALHRSGVSPLRIVTDLQSSEIVKLHEELLAAAGESYDDHGASIRTYRTVEGNKGQAQFYFRVYNQKKCTFDHDVHREETADGRTSWWCPTCQK